MAIKKDDEDGKGVRSLKDRRIRRAAKRAAIDARKNPRKKVWKRVLKSVGDTKAFEKVIMEWD